MTINIKNPTTWLITVETDMGGSTSIIAKPAVMRDGDWCNPHRYDDPIPLLANFQVRMYVRSFSGEREAFGLQHCYEAGRVELHHAEDMVKVLRRLDKRLRDMTGAEGYLNGDDFAGYLVRVARVLGVTDFRVRNTVRAREMSGDLYRLTDAPGLQSWVKDRIEDSGHALNVR